MCFETNYNRGKYASEKEKINMKKSDYDITKHDRKMLKHLQGTDDRFKLESVGVGCNKMLEPIANYNVAPCETVFSGENNSWVVLGRDRPSVLISGYGGKGFTNCGSVDIVVGRHSTDNIGKVDENGEQLYVDNDFEKDAARIYVSQKSDVDENFNISSDVKSVGKSCVGIKADSVRIIGRENIRLVTRTDAKNSQGGNVRSFGGIELLAGNNSNELQPLTKGDNTKEALEKIVNYLDKIVGTIDAFVMIQSSYNQALSTHFHRSPFFSIPTTPSLEVIPVGIKTQVDLLTKVKKDLIMHKMNLAGFKINYLSPMGRGYICSRYNKTT